MTDYFSMMRDTVGSFGTGYAKGREQRMQDEERDRLKLERGRADEAYNHQMGIRQRSDAINAEERGLLDGTGTFAQAPTRYNAGVTANNAVADANELTAPRMFSSGLQKTLPEQPSTPRMEMGAPANSVTFDPSSASGQSRMLGLNIKRAVNEGRDASQLYARQRDLNEEADVTNDIKSYKGTPEQIDNNIRHLNLSSKRITATDPDKNGILRMTVAKADGKAEYMKLTKQDQALLFAATNLMDKNPAKAMQMIAGINKTLAEAVAAENGFETMRLGTNNEATVKSSTIDHNRGMLGVAQSNAATNRDYKDRQMQVLDEQAARRSEAAGLQGKYDSLTPEQQAGQEGAAILRQFNMLNVKDGQPLALGGRGGSGGSGGILKRVVDQKQNEDGTYTAFDKATGQALYNTLHGMTLPLGMTASEYMKDLDASKAAGVRMVLGETPTGLMYKFVGADDKPYNTIAEAEKARPAPKTPQAGLTPKNAKPEMDWGIEKAIFGRPQGSK